MSDDAELEAIRARRLAEMQAKAGRGGAGGFPMNPEMAQQESEKKREIEEQRRSILTQIMESDARERLARIALVKPEKARQVEDVLINSARTGRLPGRVTDEQLKQLLEQVNQQSAQTSTKIKFQRRAEDDDY